MKDIWLLQKRSTANGVAADKVKDIKNRLRFTVKNNTTNEENPYTLNDFAEDNGVWKLELDTVAGGYTVTETVTDVTGVVLRSVSYTIDGGAAVAGKVATVDVKKNQTTTVAFTNTYEQKLGSVTSNKSVQRTGRCEGLHRRTSRSKTALTIPVRNSQ